MTTVNTAMGTYHNIQTEPEECHLNGGECFVELYLMTSQSNEFFAICLPKPVWTNFPPPLVRRTDLPQLDLQQIIDTYAYVKDKVFDRSLLCAMDFAVYLLTWQNVFLSLFNLAVAVTFCCYPNRVFSIVPFTVGVYMVLFSYPSFRRRVTMNAHTVPLNDEGYAEVASLDDTKSATTYLRRVIKARHGTVHDEDKAEHFAALSVRDGLPVLPSFAALEQELILASGDEAPWVTFSPNKITEDTPVVILPPGVTEESGSGQEELGKVVRCNADGTYVVFTELTRTNKLVEEQRLKKRLKAPYVPQWIIPTTVENQLRSLYVTMAKLRDQLIPPLMSLRKIICWENWWTSFTITAICFVIPFTLTLLHALGCGERTVVRALKMTVGLAVVFAIFVFPSWWFQRYVTILKACIFRLRHLKRYKYKRWAFFHEMSPGLYTNQEMKSLVHNSYL